MLISKMKYISCGTVNITTTLSLLPLTTINTTNILSAICLILGHYQGS